MKTKCIVILFITVSLLIVNALNLVADDSKVEHASTSDKAKYAGVNGYLIEQKYDNPSFYPLVQISKELPVHNLKSRSEFSDSVPLHTDLTIISVVSQNTEGNVMVRGIGSGAFSAIPGTGKMSPIGGYPGTRLTIKAPDLYLKPFSFLGKHWLRMTDESCVIQITKESIETYGCTVVD
ncbi:MAG: hypothetical protein AB1499_13985 [Nitrospirota bacterium]